MPRTARGGCWRAFGRGGGSRGLARCCTMLCKSDRFRLIEIRRKYLTSYMFKYHNDRDRAHIPSYIRRLSNVLYRICVNFSEYGLISMKRERKKCVVNHSLYIFSFQMSLRCWLQNAFTANILHLHWQAIRSHAAYGKFALNGQIFRALHQENDQKGYNHRPSHRHRQSHLCIGVVVGPPSPTIDHENM